MKNIFSNALFSKKNFYILFAVVLVLKLVLLFGVHIKSPDFFRSVDSIAYTNFAEQLISQGLLMPDVTTNPLGLDTIGPGYPLLIVFFFLFSDSLLILTFVNVVLAHLVSLFTYKIGLLLFKNNFFPFLAAVTVMFNYKAMFYSYRVLKESLAGFLFIWLIYLVILFFIVRKDEYSLRSYFWRIVGIGALSTYLIHTDERFIVHVLSIMLIIILFHSVRYRQRILIAVSYGALVLLLSVPWAARNNAVFGRPIFLSYRTAPYSDPLCSKLGFEWKSIEYSVPASHVYGTISISEAAIDSIAAGLNPTSLSTQTIHHIRLGLEKGIRPHQFSPAQLYWTNFIEFFKIVDFRDDYRASGFLFSGSWSLRHTAASLLCMGIYLPGFIFALLFAHRNRIIMFMLILTAVHGFYHVFFAYVITRYRIPIEPFVVLVGIYGYWQLYTMKRQHSEKKLTEEIVNP
ncbi:MAG: hypothetical protein K8R90_02020 [Candidatus Cloacimonetes bacterium]|nr:hypothetical protein [Candidatus Cloacimonadota bacterium]